MDSTEVVRMKRKFDSFLADNNLSFRINLAQQFDETPAKAKRVSGTSSQLFTSTATPSPDESAALKRETSLKDAEIVKLKANITQLHNRLSSAETSARHALVEHDKELAKLRAEKEYEATKLSDLHSKLQYVMEKERDTLKEKSHLEQELTLQKVAMDKKILTTLQEKQEAEDKAQLLKSTLHDTERELRNEILRQKNEIFELQSQRDEAQIELVLKERLQKEKCEQQLEIEELKKQLKEEIEERQKMQCQLSDHEDDLIATKALRTDLDMVPRMKSELEKLRMDNDQLRYNEQNCLLLEEKNRSLKKKLELAEAKIEQVTKLEVINEELQARLSRWEVLDASGSRRPQSPCSLSRRVTELETSQASMILKNGELQTILNSANKKLEQAQAERHKLLSELSSEKNTVTQHTDLIKRLRRKLLLISKERDSYKSLLDSYESEVTVNFDNERQVQMNRLEEMLQGYRNEAAQTESEMSTLSEKLIETQAKYEQAHQQVQIMGLPGQLSSSKHDQETIQQLKEQVAELENKLLKTQGEKDIMEARIEQRHMQGDYDPSKTKIIHVTMNPCALVQQAHQSELEVLREDNQKLRKRNQILEEQGGPVEDITIQVQEKLQQPSPNKEVEEMKAQVKREEMRNKRLMEVFKKTSQEFREICYQLTGYKIDIPCSNQYRLTSMYAASQRDYLLFQQNSKGEIQMLETEFSTTLKDAMEMYLKKQHSIPVFLSSITMDLFSQQTINFE